MAKKSLILEKIHERRISFAGFPTPVQRMPNLSRVFDGPNLFIKRDDMTDLAFGGNKARKLEFVFADAEEKGTDVIVAAGWFSRTVSAWLRLLPGSLE